MTAAYVSAGNVASAAAQTVAVPYPTGIAAGDALVLTRAAKPDTAALTTPAGWTLLDTRTGGTGVLANDTGPLVLVRYWREAAGTESGTLTVDSTTGTVDVQQGAITRYTKATGATWSVTASGGADASAGTDWSATMAADPGITSGDLVEVALAWSTDAARTWSAETLTATGATISAVSVPAAVGATGLGADIASRVNVYGATAGTSTAAPAYTATISSGINMLGPTSVVRLREVVTATSGPVAVALPALTATGTGTARTTGALAAALPALTATATGAARTTATATAALPALAAALAGGVAPPGMVVRPAAGTVTRPATGLVARPTTGTVTRP